LQSAADKTVETHAGGQGQVVDLIVRRIAHSIGVPVTALTEDVAVGMQGLNAPPVTELRTLLTTFLMLDHPAARRRCIALAEAELARQNRKDDVGATV
jgi:hypothetical protein